MAQQQCPVDDPALVVCEDVSGGGTATVNLNDYNDLISDGTHTFEWYDDDPTGSGTVFGDAAMVTLPIDNDLYVVVTTAEGCAGQTIVSYIIAETPAPLITGENMVCPETAVTYAVTDNGNTYDWDVSEAGTVTADNGSSITVEWGSDSNGPHTISVTETTSDGCSGTASLEVTVEADGVLVCNDLVQVSLDENCQAAIMPDMILEGDALYPNDSYQLTLTDEDGNTLPDNVITTIGSYTASVEHLCTGNSCWGMLLVEDKLAPTIICPDDSTLDLICTDIDNVYTPESTVLEAGDVLDTGNPTVTDNCSEVTISYSDEHTDGGDCGDDIIIRTFVATDESGNTASCTQTISIRKATIADATLPESFTIGCDELSDVLPQTLYDNGYDGFPLVTTFYGVHPVNEYYCNLAASYHDAPIADLCGGGYKVIRTWTVVDWCNSESTLKTQIIKVEDSEAPTFDCPVYEDVIAETTQGLCEADVTILDIDAFDDNCSGAGNIVVELTAPDGTISAHSVGDALALSAGTYEVTYFVEDACGNLATPCVTTLNVLDTTAPVAICDEHTVVSINTDGTAIICWNTFDDGSYDNCSEIHVRVKRMDASNNVDFTECVEFDCSDIGETVLVRMRVYDVVPNGGFEDDDDGRFNECMVEVTVQDKLDPVIVCPPDKTFECHADYSDVPELVSNSSGGAPTFFNGELAGYYPAASDNCEVTVSISDSGSIDNCGEGTIVRTWTAEDGDGRTATCEQLLTIENASPFSEDDVVWPEDYDANCGADTEPEDLPDGYNFPVIDEDACDLLAVTYSDQVFEITEDACYKIVRTWIIIDWCQFDDSQFPFSDGYWQYAQVIKVVDDVDPEITSDCSDIEVCNYDIDCGSTEVVLILEATDACSEDLNYSYQIDAFYDGTLDSGPLFNGDSNNATNDFPVGTHHIYWTVEDGCGNITTCDYSFTVRDCKNPTPVLLNGLATVVMPYGQEITLWGSDFDGPNSGSFDNCTASEDLSFYIRIVDADSPELTTLEEIEALGNSATFTCENLGFANVEVYVVDEAGNWEVGATFANIQDPNGACVAFQLGGEIYTEMDEMVGEVTVDLNSANSTVDPFITESDGHYQFGVVMGENYTVTPEKDINPLNGVTTYDIVLVSKHILGIELLNSPYKIIAADANHSGSVTTFDLVQMRRLILNIDTEFPTNTSWRFVDAGFVFPDPMNPFATIFPEQIFLNDMDQANMANNFIGIKIGDVNNSAIPNTLLGVEDRSFDDKLIFEIKDQQLQKGETYNVAIYAKDFDAIIGYQYTLNFDNNLLAFEDMQAGSLALTENNFGWNNIQDGIITTSWNDSKGISLKENTLLYTLSFTAKSDGLLSEALHVNSTYTTAEGYNSAEEILEVVLSFQNTKTTPWDKTRTHLTNHPNPFNEATRIAFELPEAMQATITFTDISGKQLKKIEGYFAKGYNELLVTAQELGSKGIICYELRTDDFVLTNKMILAGN